MRLICPSCGAQYEVDESVIPDGGRDVQCSNCGHAWFQHSARRLREEAARKAAAAAEPAPPSPAPAADQGAAAVAPAPEPPTETAAAENAKPAAARPRRTLDDAVRNVLREEAERETRARMAEGTSVEMQPDLGLAAAATAAAGRAAETPQDRVAKVGGEPHDFDEDALVPRAARRELLPDIEEINSTLRATSERGNEAAAVDAPETLARRRSGFRMGFSTALLVSAALLALYVLAPGIAEKVPALEPTIASYVATVDSGRVWLDERMRSLTAALQSDGQN